MIREKERTRKMRVRERALTALTMATFILGQPKAEEKH